jgi:uridine phosphorylase
METFQLFHLARSWSKPRYVNGNITNPTPLTTTAVSTIATGVSSNIVPSSIDPSAAHTQADAVEKHESSHRIRAAAAQMVFAARLSKDFITPQQVVNTEAWTGRAVLEALCRIPLGEEVNISF